MGFVLPSLSASPLTYGSPTFLLMGRFHRKTSARPRAPMPTGCTGSSAGWPDSAYWWKRRRVDSATLTWGTSFERESKDPGVHWH